MSVHSAESPSNQEPVNPIQAGAEAARGLTGAPKAHWLERLATRLGHPEDQPIKIGGFNNAWDAPAVPPKPKAAPKPEQTLSPQERAIVDSTGGPESDPFVLP